MSRNVRMRVICKVSAIAVIYGEIDGSIQYTHETPTERNAMDNKLTIRITDDMKALLDRKAEQLNTTPSDVVRTAIEHYFNVQHPTDQRSQNMQKLLFETAKTRALLLEIASKLTPSVILTDAEFDAVEQDAHSYVNGQTTRS